MAARSWRQSLGAAALLALLGCARAEVAVSVKSGPPEGYAQRAIEMLLPGLQFGPDAASHTIRELRKVDVAGSHFSPGANRWVVHYCAEFVSYASEELQRRCDMNVQLYELDSKKWVGFASGAGTLYRWQLLEEATPNDPAPEASAPNATE
ncbi:MAG: hypothetical protein FJ091_20250 [Deltaproteobacteria bacterium]|nr:hypothetical protein [Deltaproteobacteria bacterium]